MRADSAILRLNHESTYVQLKFKKSDLNHKGMMMVVRRWKESNYNHPAFSIIPAESKHGL